MVAWVARLAAAFLAFARRLAGFWPAFSSLGLRYPEKRVGVNAIVAKR
jgi:hypothetical protein